MAKKEKKKIKFDPEATSKVIETQINAVRQQLGQRSIYLASDHDKRTFGLGTPPGVCSLPLGYLTGANVLPMQRVIQVAGDPSSYKSSECFEYMRWIMEQGGKAILIETEGKLSYSMLSAQLKGLAEKCIIREVGSLEEAHTACSGFISEVSDALDKQGVVLPTLIVIDSLAGKNTADMDEQIRKEGHAEGRSYGPAVAAGQNTVYFKTLSNLLVGLPVLVIFTNHRKKSMSEQGGYGGPAYSTPGGSAVKFFSTLQLANESGSSYLKQLMTSASEGIEGECIRIIMDKCGTGPDNRYIEVPVLWTFDAEGKQNLWWDWNASAAFFLKRIFENDKSKFTFYAKRLKAIMDLDIEKNKWSSKTLKLEEASPSEVGLALAQPENDTLLREIEKCFGISRFSRFQEFEYE